MKKLLFLLCATSLCKQNIVIVDLSTVLLKENMSEFIKQMGLPKLASYTLYHFKNPGDGCLDFLHRVGQEPEEKSDKTMCYKNRIMPKCMVDWHIGNISYNELIEKLKKHNEKLLSQGYFRRAQDKELIDELVALALNPTHAHEVIQLSPASIPLTQDLKKNNCRLYGLANMSPETFNAIKKKHPDFFAAFDDILISGQVKHLIPEQQLFKTVIKKHNLQAEACVYIEGNKEYAKEAKKVGLKPLMCSNARSMRLGLKKAGLL